MPLTEDQLVGEYAPLVRRLALQLISRLPPSVELDDLLQAGLMGLLDAVRRYQQMPEAQFETYAVTRIRGAMLDELRSQDWLPRSVRAKARTIEQAVHKLEQQLLRPATESEIATELGMSLSDYQHMLAKVRGTQLVYLEDITGRDDDEEGFLDRHMGDTEADPSALLQDQRMRMALVEAIKNLPEREQQIMSMYYEHDMNLKEIAAVLGVTESRVCQLHSQSIARLRAKLREH